MSSCSIGGGWGGIGSSTWGGTWVSGGHSERPQLTAEELARCKQREKARWQQHEIDKELQEFENRVVRAIKPGSGMRFKDAPDTPEMVIVPRGKSRVTWRPRLLGKSYSKFTLRRDMAISRFAITFDEWDASNCSAYKPSDLSWGRGNRPVINVSWQDAQDYVEWLRARTGRLYRLLYTDEWEYACRAGTKTPFWWGRVPTQRRANFAPMWGAPRGWTVPVDSFEPNRWGLYQMHGNVWEWCGSYIGDAKVCGGSFAHSTNDLRSDSCLPARLLPQADGREFARRRDKTIGFRVCRYMGTVIRKSSEYHPHKDFAPTSRYPEPILEF